MKGNKATRSDFVANVETITKLIERTGKMEECRKFLRT